MHLLGETLVYWIEKVLGLKNGALSQAYGSDPILVQVRILEFIVKVFIDGEGVNRQVIKQHKQYPEISI